MKITALVLFLSASAMFASDAALPSFSKKLFDRPELSLSEAVRTGQLPPFNPATMPAVEILRRASAGQKRVVSRMPVIEPTSEVDRRMPIVAPRMDIEAKMLVKEGSVDSVK